MVSLGNADGGAACAEPDEVGAGPAAGVGAALVGAGGTATGFLFLLARSWMMFLFSGALNSGNTLKISS